MPAGIKKRLRLFSTLHVVGWVVLMPALVIAVMSPFVNFDAWPGATADAKPTQVALLPPRLTEHGSLPPLTETPAPASAVPTHTPIAADFTPAPAPRLTGSPSGRRGGPGQAPRTRTRRQRPTRGGTPARPREAIRRPAAGSPVATPSPVPTAQPPASPRPGGPGGPESTRPAQGNKPQDPGPGKPQDPGPGKPQDPGPGKPQNPGKPQDPGPGRPEDPGKPQDPGPGNPQQDRGSGKQDRAEDRGNGQGGKPDDPGQGRGPG